MEVAKPRFSPSFEMKRVHFPAFGNWDYCNELPITQYFESAMQAGVLHDKHFGEDGDLFYKVYPATAKVKPTYHGHHHSNKKVKKEVVVEKQHQLRKEHQRKPRKVCNLAEESPRKDRVSKAVDEDLYKIPPELLYQKSKMKRLLRSLWCGCMGLNCIA